MRRALLLLVAAAALLASCKREPVKLAADIVVPGRGRLPTFRIECRNNTTQAVERVNVIDAARVDGTVLTRHVVGSFIGGPPSPMQPGAVWTEMIALAPTEWRGFDVGIPIFHVPLQPGKHSVAFRCAGVWSEDVVFYWEPPL